MTEIGLIFHWGLYSITAYDDPISARRRRIQNGSEWYLKRLMEKGTYRPIAGWQQTQTYHHEEFNDFPYYDLAQFFDMDRLWNPDDWMQLAKEVGASYVILTTKHHDGFCLWPTKTASPHTDEDYVTRFVASARRHHLKVGLYYSWSEFGQRCTKDYLDTIALPQVEELKQYQPDIWWFDGHWDVTTKYACQKIRNFIVSLGSNVEINDRLYKDTRWDDPSFLGEATYRVYGDRHIPVEKPNIPWEHINTIGLSWGLNLAQEDRDYKTGEEIFDLYCEIHDKGGRFLLNLGPDCDGYLDKQEVQPLLDFGTLYMKQ